MEIEALIARYVTALDTLDADAYASVFAEDALFYHVMSNTSIEILDETNARHQSYAQTVRAADDGRFIIGFMGRYEDVLVKRDGRWMIQSRKLVSFVQ